MRALRVSSWDLAGLASIVTFGVALGLMLRPAARPAGDDAPATDASSAVRAGDEWLGLYMGGDKVGRMHLAKTRRDDGWRFALNTVLRLGGTGPLTLDLQADLSTGLALQSFEFTVDAGATTFRGQGAVNDRTLTLTTDGGTRTLELPRAPVLNELASLQIVRGDLRPGTRSSFPVFDPITQAEQEMEVEVVGPDTLQVMGREVPVTHVRQKLAGTTLDAWIDARGEALRQELGLGLVAVRETEEEARWMPGAPPDLSAVTDVPVAGLAPRLDDVPRLDLKLGGVDLSGFALDDGPTGRQTLRGDRLTVRIELDARGAPLRPADPALEEALGPSPLVQSDAPAVRELAASIVGDAADTTAAARRIVAWIRENVRQERVPGVPSALETLRSRVGDCNEHSALFAALARAAGVPTRLVAGLAYRDGRFAYHAWDEYLAADGWTTVDPTWGQLPADVGHLRFVRGGLDRQVELVRLMGRLRLDRVDP